MSSTECANFDKLDENLIKELDACYHVAVEHETHTKDVLFMNSEEEVETGYFSTFPIQNRILVSEEVEEIQPWSFMDSLLFAFTVITTIGSYF